jgi:hypothetical protein
MSINSFHWEHVLLFDFPYALVQSSEVLSPGNYITVPESKYASWHIYHLVTSQIHLALAESLKLHELGRSSLQTSSLGDFGLVLKSLTKNLTKSGDYNPRVIQRSTWPRSRNLVQKGVSSWRFQNLGAQISEMSSCTIVILPEPPMTKESYSGEALQRAKVKLMNMIVHSPQSIHVIDIIRNGRSMTRFRLESSKHFPDCEGLTP